MSTKRRVIHGIGANGFGQAVTLLIQLASVPILIHAWGIELYGEWITLSAIPAYLVLSDIGLSFVAGNSLALIAEKGDIRQMQTIYQSTWVMVTSSTLIVLVPVGGIIWFAEPGHFLGLQKISGNELSATLLLLFSHVALSMQTGILQLPFRALKKNPFAVAAVNVIRLLEWIMATVVVLNAGGVVEVATAFLLTRMLGNISLWLIVGRSGSPLRIGIRYANLQTIRIMLGPSLASMCFPLGLSFTIQGFILMIGGMVGSVGVAVFSIYRTFTRVPIQLATAINQAIWPELSYAFGANDIVKAKKLVMRMLQFGAILSISSAVAVYFLGETAIDLWVTKALTHNSQLLIALALAALIHVLWQPFWVALMATNKHSRFAGYFLAVSALSLFLGWVFLLIFGLTGAGYAILAAECLMVAAAFFFIPTAFWGGLEMIKYILYLLNNRIKEAPFSYPWFKVWGKRVVNLNGLIRILYRIARLSSKGAEIGDLSVVGILELNGKASNLKIGRECVLGGRVHLALHDRIVLGNHVVVNDGCILLTASHDVNDPEWKHVKAPIIMEDYAWIATNAIILPGVTVGYGAVVGAGAVVTKNIPAFSVVGGNPARILKQRVERQFSYSTVRFLAPIEAWVGIRDKFI